MPRVSVVTDSTSYLPAEVVERHGIHVVPLYIVFGGDRTVPETDITDYHAFFEELRAAAEPPHHLAALGRRLHLRVRAAPGRRRRGRLGPHLGRACRARRSPRGARPRRSSARARAASGCSVFDSTTAAGGLGLMVLAAASAAAAGTPAAEIVARLAEARGELRLWFADRHAGVPAARRPDRRGERLDRLDAAGEADPDGPERDDARGAGAHQLARVRAHGGLPAPVPRVRRRGLVRPAHQLPRGPRPAGGARPRDLRPRAHRVERDRPGARHAHGAGPARRGRRSRSSSCPRALPGRPGAQGQSRGARASREDDRPHRADHRRRRGLPLPDLPGAQAAHLDLHLGLPGDRAGGPREPALASHAARLRDRGGVRRACCWCRSR